VELQQHAFWALALDGKELSASSSGPLSSGKGMLWVSISWNWWIGSLALQWDSRLERKLARSPFECARDYPGRNNCVCLLTKPRLPLPLFPAAKLPPPQTLVLFPAHLMAAKCPGGLIAPASWNSLGSHRKGCGAVPRLCCVSRLMVTTAVARSIFPIDKPLTLHRLATTKRRLPPMFYG
jgi:hypothetical protein